MYFTVDDISKRYISNLYKLEEFKIVRPDFKVTVFPIAGEVDSLIENWLVKNKDWVEVGIHGWLHDDPPECERDNREELIKESYGRLSSLLPNKFGFRAPGFQITASTYPILRDMGFWYVAHQSRIQPLRQIGEYNQDIIVNSHIYDDVLYEINEIKAYEGNFKFISEGFNNNASQV